MNLPVREAGARERAADALGGEELQVLDVEDRRAEAHEPRRERSVVVAYEEDGAAALEQSVGFAAQAERIVDVLHRLEAGHEGKAPALEIRGAKGSVANEALDGRRGDGHGRGG